MQLHLRDMYPSEDSAAAVFYKDNLIFVNISAEKVNLRNFWSGEMHSSWVITVVSNDIISIAGDIKVRDSPTTALRTELFLCIFVLKVYHHIFFSKHFSGSGDIDHTILNLLFPTYFCRFMLIILRMVMCSCSQLDPSLQPK